MKQGLVRLLYNFGKRFMGWTLHMIMCVLLCYPVSIRIYYQQGVLFLVFITLFRGQGGRVVTFSPPTSEAGVQFPAQPQVGKLVVACCRSAVYSTEP